jgi:glycosyltransferase involved in cell wall biosynthesis
MPRESRTPQIAIAPPQCDVEQLTTVDPPRRETAPKFTILIVTCNYPALSETFINRELAALEERGHRLLVVNCFKVNYPQKSSSATPVVIPWEEGITWVNSVRAAWKLAASPWATLRVARATLRLSACAKPGRVWRGWLVFLRILALGGEHVPTVFVHYLSTPAIAAHLLAKWSGKTFVASGHAADLFQASPQYLRRVCECARAVVTCTEAGRRRLVAAGVPCVQLVRHGVEIHESIVPRTHPHSPIRLLTVARLVEKKGHEQLLKAAKRLADLGCDFEWRFLGDGELASTLHASAAQLEIAGRVRWLGACGHAATLAEISRADLFVYHSIVTNGGDRDGVPNVLLEALATGTRVLCSDFPGAEELRSLLPSTPMLEVLPFDAKCWAERLVRAAEEALPSAAERQAARAAVLLRYDAAKALKLVERALGIGPPVHDNAAHRQPYPSSTPSAR